MVFIPVKAEVILLLIGINGLNMPTSKVTADGSYYYFSRLTDEQKTAYKVILSGIRTFSEEIKMPTRPINEVSMIFNYVLLDNLMIFYVSSFCQSNDSYKKKCLVKPQYKYVKPFTKTNAATVKKYLQTFDAVKKKTRFARKRKVPGTSLIYRSY